MDREPPKEILDHLKKWKINSAVLRFFHVLFLIIIIVTSVLVASRISLPINNFDEINWLAVIVAISTGLFGGLDLGSKSNSMRRAWRVLNSAVIRYKEDPTFTINDLMKAYDDGENTIGDVNAKI